MCIYCGTNKYRKIYEKHYGLIPKDESGRTYDIHHKDGNHSNNSPDNLIAVTLVEHFNLHYQNEDFSACVLIGNRMRLSPGEISELAKKNAMKSIANGTHNFIGESNPSKEAVRNGTHNFFGGEIQRKTNKKRVTEGTHNFLDSDLQRITQLNRIAANTHHFLDSNQQRDRGLRSAEKQFKNGTHPSQKTWICAVCDKSGKGSSNFTRWHKNCGS